MATIAMVRSPDSRHEVYLAWRRWLDAAVSLVALVLLSPALALLALAIRLDSPGPVLFRQVRIGRDRRRRGDYTGPERRVDDLGGQPFRLFKLRTMTDGAEARTGAVWCRAGDPRVTRLGRALRAWHLDELPQLWNVVRGEMALIGPRPERPCFVARFTERLPHYPSRHAVRPGLSGLAQVRQGYDRNLADVRRKLRWDRRYIADCSPWLDLRIAWETVRVIVLGGLGRHPDAVRRWTVTEPSRGRPPWPPVVTTETSRRSAARPQPRAPGSRDPPACAVRGP